jgi:AraC-like DNA-binding protein
MFTSQFGRPPEDWLREERLQAALRLLPAATSVKEVAYALAFPQVSQFCRDFKARFGCTPSEWMSRAGATRGSDDPSR